MSYWFSDDATPALVRPISAIYECDDREILARVIEVTL